MTFKRAEATETTMQFLRDFFVDRVGESQFLSYDDRNFHAACGGLPHIRAEHGGKYHVVKAARDALKRDPDHIFIDVLEGTGLYRVPNGDVAKVVRRQRLGRVARQMKRGRVEMQCTDLARLTPAQLAEWNATVFHMTAIQAATTPEAVKRVEDAVASVDPRTTAIRAMETLKRLTL